ncbi:MAG: hypothetical protein LBU89_06460 [Fibromonadaceae bacterium]|jgi:hypothetical protein|nr:hypothetical protein [Fibromonadaceae bacterium]
MARRTAQLFDLMFKSIIKDASSSAIVHLINGIYKKNYSLDTTAVKIEPTEFITEHPKSGKLKKIVSDIVITLYDGNCKDTYFIEAQISDDIEMLLRIFNYSVLVALEGKEVSDDGSYMQIDMPSPAVIYWESSETKDFVSIKIKFPNKRSVVYKVPAFKVLQHSVSELENMALLLPFYILKIRGELKKTKDSEKRKELSNRLEGYVIEISQVLKRCVENNYITDRDAAMLLRRLLSMNLELYGKYREFKEVNMSKRLEKLVDPGFCERWDKALAKEAAKVEKRSLKQGKIAGLIEAAKSMLKDGLDPARVARITDLPIKQIRAMV